MRFLVAPRQLMLHVLMLVLVAAMTWLCLWQLGKAQHPHQAPSGQPSVSVQSVSQPGQLSPEAFNRPITAEGVYLPAQTVLIPDRMLHGRSGSWVLTPLRLPDGSVLAVVRGWSDQSITTGEVPVSVQLSGHFLPPEQAPARPSARPGEVATVDLAALSPLWGNPALHEGYLLASSEHPPPTDLAGVSLTRIPASNAETSDTGAPFSNAAYALQWLAFSAFVVFLWWRILRDGWRRQAISAEAGVDIPFAKAKEVSE